MVAESALSPLCSDYAKRTGVLLSPRGSSSSPPAAQKRQQPVSVRLFSEGKRQRARREALQAAVIEQQEIASQKMFHVIRSRSPEQGTQQLRSTEPPPLPLEVVSQQRRRGGPNKGAVYSPSAAALPASERLHRHAGDALRRRQEAIQADTAAMFTPNTNERRKRERRRQQQQRQQRQEEDSNSTGGLGERNRRFVRQQRKAEIHALQERLASPLKRAGNNAQQRERVLLEHAMDMLFQAVYSTDAARAAFRRIDTDGDRCLSRDEFQRALYLMPGLSSLSQEQVYDACGINRPF